ncbi:hypothetical protein NFI96_028995 [Prochilodus magdalenae]|nr:hypothetical protein NFI96_028995 [Prochilodus magdalenae]
MLVNSEQARAPSHRFYCLSSPRDVTLLPQDELAGMVEGIKEATSHRGAFGSATGRGGSRGGGARAEKWRKCHSLQPAQRLPAKRVRARVRLDLNLLPLLPLPLLLLQLLMTVREGYHEPEQVRRWGRGPPGRRRKMGALSVDLLVTLQILPGFFSNCLFFVLYDSVVLVKRVVSLLSCSGSGGEWQRMLTAAGLKSIWNSFLLDAYKQVKMGESAPNSKVVRVPGINGCRWSGGGKSADECRLLDFESSERPLVVNFGSAT